MLDVAGHSLLWAVLPWACGPGLYEKQAEQAMEIKPEGSILLRGLCSLPASVLLTRVPVLASLHERP